MPRSLETVEPVDGPGEAIAEGESTETMSEGIDAQRWEYVRIIRPNNVKGRVDVGCREVVKSRVDKQ